MRKKISGLIHYLYLLLAVVNLKLNKMTKNKKTWYEWIFIWIGCWQIGTWIGDLINLIDNHLHSN